MPIIVSIIVPAHKLDACLRRCIRSLEALDFPDERYEIIVVTDGVEHGGFFEGLRVRAIPMDKAGPAAARNKGASLAQGEFLAFTDSDCLVYGGWLQELLRCFEDQGVAGVGGAQLSPPDDTPFGKSVQTFFVAISFIGGYTRRHRDVRPVEHNPSCNVCYRRSAFEQEGGFDPSLFPGEDLDLDLRLRRRGQRLIYNPAAVVYHYRPARLSAFARMMERYGMFSGGYLTRRYGFFRKISYEPIALLLALCAVLGITFISPLLGAQIILAILFSLLIYFWWKTGSISAATSCVSLLLVTLLYWNIGYIKGLIHSAEDGPLPPHHHQQPLADAGGS